MVLMNFGEGGGVIFKKSSEEFQGVSGRFSFFFREYFGGFWGLQVRLRESRVRFEVFQEVSEGYLKTFQRCSRRIWDIFRSVSVGFMEFHDARGSFKGISELFMEFQGNYGDFRLVSGAVGKVSGVFSGVSESQEEGLGDYS